MNPPSQTPPSVPGFTLLRLLAERERVRVFLARDQSGALCATKVVESANRASLNRMIQKARLLQPLSRQPGLLPILEFGATEEGWFWKRLPLVDNASGPATLEDLKALEQFSPLTLRARLLKEGPAQAQTVARWGLRLAGALSVLHNSGLVHRDVKPGNVFFLNGEPCLGDYGLVAEGGIEPDFRGTEGYRPMEGTSAPSADLFALGRTLYEAWTGHDRLEFPSLPRPVIDAPDWAACGSLLNEVILKACHDQARKRFQSAAEFSAALDQVLTGTRPINRRRWLATAAGIAGAGLGVWGLMTHLRPAARLVWTRIREKGFGVEAWRADIFNVDWQTRRVYSASWHRDGATFLTLDLSDFSLSSPKVESSRRGDLTSCFNPVTRELWVIDCGKGEVTAMKPDTFERRNLGGGPPTLRHFNSRCYWNPVTERIGILGGYGMFSTTNERCEFDADKGQWITLDADRDEAPWRRSFAPLIPHPGGRKLYAYGGNGSPSGKQGAQHPGLRCFNGQFHNLDDVWELDLEANTWRCLLPIGRLDPRRLAAAAWFPALGGLVVFEGADVGPSESTGSRAWLLRESSGYKLENLRFEGQRSQLIPPWLWYLEPGTEEVVMLASDGIFRIRAEWL